MNRFLILFLVGVAGIGCASRASASLIATFSGFDEFDPEGDLKASVAFQVVGNELIVTLTNTATDAIVRPSQLLSAVFFNILDESGALATGGLEKIDARLADGSVILNAEKATGGANVGADGTMASDPGNIGPEWAYRDDLPLWLPVGSESDHDNLNAGYRHFGISSAGLDYFGPDDRFVTGANTYLDSPDSPNGMNYLIAPAAGLGEDANKKLSSEPVVSHQVVFRFVVDPGFDVLSIDNVVFQFGTGLDGPAIFVSGQPDTHFAGGPDVIPEPSAWLVFAGLAMCLAGGGWFSRLRKGKH